MKTLPEIKEKVKLAKALPSLGRWNGRFILLRPDVYQSASWMTAYVVIHEAGHCASGHKNEKTCVCKRYKKEIEASTWAVEYIEAHEKCLAEMLGESALVKLYAYALEELASNQASYEAHGKNCPNHLPDKV